MALHPENICDAVIESSKNRIVLHRKMRASAERNAQPKRIVPWLSAQCENSAKIVGKLGEYFAIPIIAGFKLVRIKKFIIMGMVSPHEIMSFSHYKLKLTVWGHCPSNACGWLASEFCERRLDSQECEHANQRNCVAHALTVVFA